MKTPVLGVPLWSQGSPVGTIWRVITKPDQRTADDVVIQERKPFGHHKLVACKALDFSVADHISLKPLQGDLQHFPCYGTGLPAGPLADLAVTVYLPLGGLLWPLLVSQDLYHAATPTASPAGGWPFSHHTDVYVEDTHWGKLEQLYLDPDTLIITEVELSADGLLPRRQTLPISWIKKACEGRIELIRHPPSSQQAAASKEQKRQR